jgi:probable F420-dependent oxidoreductase
MKLGIYAVLTDASPPVTELARALEERGFESLWVPEHSHIPTVGNTPYPGRGPVTRDFARTLDPFVALAAAASVTERLKLGTGICLLIQRDTIHTAKTVATLDHLSGGRVLFGVGGGWNKPEMENHGTVYATRFAKLEEQIHALRAIWTEEEAEYHGALVDFAPLWCWPKPVTLPHPPVFIGGETDHTLRRVVRCADGWLPRMRDPEHVLAQIPKLHAFAREAGRDPASIAISAFALPAKPDAIARFRDAGVTRAILALPPGDRDETMRRLDRYADLSKGERA